MSNDLLAINSGRLLKLLRYLIDIYSPSGKEEEILEFLYGYLRRRNLPVRRQQLDDHRYNLLVAPPDNTIELMLVGHLDTVTAYDLDHYESKKQEDLVTGLGAADMKGGCAALVEAYVRFLEVRHALPPASLALVVGEEEEGDGADRLVEEHHAPWALVAEPTGLHPCLGCYGYVEIQIAVRGMRRHASLATSKQNPVEAVLHLVSRLSHYFQEHRPELVYNIRDLFSSQSGFAVSDRCEAWLDVHVPPTAPMGEITMELEEVVACGREDVGHLDATIRFTTIDAGYELPEKGPIVETLKEAYTRRTLPWNIEAFRSHSDANRLWAAGVKPLLVGPGQLEQAHAPDESISFHEVERAADLYLAFLDVLAR